MCLQDWIAFLDVDEFLVLRESAPMDTDVSMGAQPEPLVAVPRPEGLPQPLSPLDRLLFEFEGAAALVANWLVFGSNAQLSAPPGVLGYYSQ